MEARRRRRDAARIAVRTTTNNSLLGTGAFARASRENDDYRRGYLCGMIRGDAT
jgi:hypothetical protein